MTTTQLHPHLVDVGVLILFFNRPEPLAQVFAQVRKARPSRLFLYQDGPRNEQDLPKLEACRKVVERIDWECEVHRNYQTVNAGCDPSNYNAQRWAFSLCDKVVMLEDDSVPSVSFFSFCKELLDRYENDERIFMIAGFNSDEVTPDVPDDYFFTSTFSVWGWASWKRVIDLWDEHYAWLDNPYAMRQLKAVIKERDYRRDLIPMARNHRASGKAYYETIFWSAMLLNNGLAIVPTRNMVNNLGPLAESVHYGAHLNTLPRRLRRLFTMKRFEQEGPIRHPAHVVELMEYKEHDYRTRAWNHPWVKMRYSMEELWLNLRHGHFRHIGKSIVRRWQKMTGKRRDF